MHENESLIPEYTLQFILICELPKMRLDPAKLENSTLITVEDQAIDTIVDALLDLSVAYSDNLRKFTDVTTDCHWDHPAQQTIVNMDEVSSSSVASKPAAVQSSSGSAGVMLPNDNGSSSSALTDGSLAMTHAALPFKALEGIMQNKPVV